MPPLRERIEDIPALVWAFIDEFSKAFGKRIDFDLEGVACAQLQRYSWPGNVRELRNVIERAVIRRHRPSADGVDTRVGRARGTSRRTDAEGAGDRAHPRRAREHQLAGARRRRRGRTSRPQADDAREPDGEARRDSASTVIVGLILTGRQNRRT